MVETTPRPSAFGSSHSLCLSLIDILRAAALEQPEKPAYLFLRDGEEEGSSLTYGELDARARAIGALLQASGVAGERALLLYPPGLDFVTAFLGCLYGGVVAVPAYPPRSKRPVPQLRAIVEDACPKVVLTSSGLRSRVDDLGSWLPGFETLECLVTDGVDPELRNSWVDPGASSASLAFLQYTSGSTSLPKGVMVSHGNLLHNQEMIQRSFGQTEDSVIVSWLPLYHDMGLIGGVLHPIYVGARCLLMSPGAFLQRPERWLAAISKYQATTSGGPSFAYELCARKVEGEEVTGLDLSSWRVAFNGSEPVRAETLDRFARAFAEYGFERRAFCPCYGLAEATLFVTGGAPGVEPVVEPIDGKALEEGRWVRGSSEPSRRWLVASGQVASGQQVIIVDPETRTACSADQVGEIWISGPNVASGYWNRPQATAEAFQARLSSSPDAGPFLRTGDLGCLTDGELFVTGRIKDLIIVRGRNFYPQDIELSAEQAVAALRPGCGAAFAVDEEGEERLVVVYELDRHQASAVAEVAEAVRRAVTDAYEVAVHDVVLLRIGSIPKTSSGKVQRHICRARYRAEDWAILGRSRVDRATQEPEDIALDALLDLDLGERRRALDAYLKRAAARAIGLAPERFGNDRPLTHLGLDSLAAIELQQSLEVHLQAKVSLAELLAGSGLGELVELLLQRLDDITEPEVVPVVRAPESTDGMALTYGQRSLWFVHRLAPASTAYHLVAAMRVRGSLDVVALRRAVDTLADRHPALRTTFHAGADGEPVQRVHEHLPPDFSETEASSWGPARLQECLHHEAYHPFDLETGPLFRVRVLVGSPGRSILLIALHHLVADFWSLTVLARELGAIYSEPDGGSGVLGPAVGNDGDLVVRERRRLSGEEGRRLGSYWQERLRGVPATLGLATDRPRPPIQTYEGAAICRNLGSATSAGVQGLARSCGATLFMTLLAAFQVLLHRYTGRRDLAVGSPTAGRDSARLAGVVGYLVNPVVLRADFSHSRTFRAFLAETRQSVLAALAHQAYPLALLTEQLRLEHDPSRSPLFQAMFVFERPPRRAEPSLAAFALGVAGARMSLGDLQVESIHLEERSAPFDLSLSMAEVDGALLASLRYNTGLFDATTIHRMMNHLQMLISGAVSGAVSGVVSGDASGDTMPIHALPMLRPAEAQQLQGEWSQEPGAVSPRDRAVGLHQLFEAQVTRTPQAIALVCGDNRLTYSRLDTGANRLAHALRDAGVGPEVRVAVCLERSPDLVLAVLAVLKAGGAYVPLDPAYPSRRLAFMLEDSGAQVLLSRREALGPRDVSSVHRIDPTAALEGQSPESPAVVGHPRNLAYVIYTSGSTGQPKGVAIEHRSPIELIRWAQQVYSEESSSGVLAATSICFDLSVFELFLPLSSGGKIVLVESAMDLPSLPAAREVTLINTVPSAMTALAESALPKALTTVNLAGEPLPPALVRKTFEHPQVARVINLYGPSEDTTYSTLASFERSAPGASARVTIGRPLTGRRAFLTDEALRPVPLGVPGEILLGGVGLARGYLGRAALTAERFVPSAFAVAPGGRLYRTGDRARFLPNGALDLLGRFDHQVKLRGFRIELGEVEAALEALGSVREAAALVHADRDLLIAYAAPKRDLEQAGTTGDLLGAELARKLPGPMVPAVLVLLEELPRTPNGKVDRAALAGLPFQQRTTTEATGWRSPLEELLAGIFAELFGVEAVNAGDNFFELGGHSLLAMRLVARIREACAAELPVRAIFAGPTVRELAQQVAAARQTGRDPLPDIEPIEWPTSRRTRPLSFAQQRMWLLHRLDPAGATYNLPVALRLTGSLSEPALAAALEEIVRRHEVLRSRVVTVDGKPRQEVQPAPRIVLPTVDLQGLSESSRQTTLRLLERQEAARSFDLEHGPLWRGTLLALAEGQYELLVTMHHIISDGWSMGLWARELGLLVAAFASDRPSMPRLPELPIRYADYAVWQRRWLSGDVLRAELAYWRERLGAPAGERPKLELPTDRPRPPVQTYRGSSRWFALPAELVGDLERLSRAHGATLYMTLLGVFQVLLGRISQQMDVAVGTPIAGRTHRTTEELIGLFVNTLVLRTDLGGAAAFDEVLRRVREVTLGAYGHQQLPFEKLVEELQPQRDLSTTPLFQAMFALQNAPFTAPRVPGLEVELLPLDSGTAKFDLTLALQTPLRPAAAGGLEGRITYNRDLFDGATLSRFAGHYQTLLQSLREDFETRLDDLAMLSVAERHQLQVEWNATAVARTEACLHQRFERQVVRTPAASAVVSGDQIVTYRELDRRSNRLANYLRQRGVGPEVWVGVRLRRSVDQVIAVLGVLKAGGGYLPLDPGDPPRRLLSMLEEARPRLLLTAAHLGGVEAWTPRAPCQVVCLDRDRSEIFAHGVENPEVAMAAENLAYALYTSGSTGQPKGVQVTHGNALNYLDWVARELFAGDVESVPWVTRLTFDASLKQLFSPLFCGRAVQVLAEDVVSQPAALSEALRERRCRGLNAVPTLWQALIATVEAGQAQAPTELRCVYSGGESLSRGLIERTRKHLPDLRWVNLYGPTEATANASWSRPTGERQPGIGRPLANVGLQVLDAGLRPVGVGVTAQLCIRGAGVARGYLRRPALTAQVFVPDPHAPQPGARLYLTGDQARRLPDGSLDLLGRRDQQVKIRGFRIELGEIEEAIRRLPAVEEAVVLVRDDAPGGRQLVVAYVARREVPGTSDSGAPDEGFVSTLREALRARLPEYMKPALYLTLPALPRTLTGKLDRVALAQLALPEPAGSGASASAAEDAPSSPVEEVLAGMMAEVLGLDQVGIHDNFFEIGGHSLLAAELVTLIQDSFEVELPLLQLFEAATVSDLAQCLLDDPIQRLKVEATAPLLMHLAEADEGDLPEEGVG